MASLPGSWCKLRLRTARSAPLVGDVKCLMQWRKVALSGDKMAQSGGTMCAPKEPFRSLCGLYRGYSTVGGKRADQSMSAPRTMNSVPAPR